MKIKLAACVILLGEERSLGARQPWPSERQLSALPERPFWEEDLGEVKYPANDR